MRARNRFGMIMSVLVAAGFVVALSGCFGIPKGTMKDVKVGDVQLKVSGAGIVKADAQKVTFKIKCAVCGFQSDEITVDTPAAGKPYTMDWVCPKCGHKQKIVIQAVAALPEKK